MLSRLSAARRLPRTFAVRYYADGRTEGSVAQSKGFRYINQASDSYLTNILFQPSKKEKAHEGKKTLFPVISRY